MRINNTNILIELTKNNFYKSKWKFFESSQNSVNYLLPNLKLVIKIHKIVDKENKSKLDTTNFFNLPITTYSRFGYCNPFREIVLLYMTNELHQTNICPHFPIIVTYTILNDNCKKCNTLIQNKLDTYPDLCNDIKKYLKLQIVSNNSVYIFKEFIEGEFNEIFKSSHSNLFWMSMLFQILYAILCCNKHLDTINFDLHLNNIFFKKIPPGGHWVYIINNIKYYIPNFGYVFIIADNGNILSTKFKLTKREIKEHKLIKNIHLDVYSFIKNFTKRNIKKYHIHWYHKNTIIAKVKKLRPLLYKEIINNYKSKLNKNISECSSLISNKEIYKSIITNVINDSDLFHTIVNKVNYPSDDFNNVIGKYLKYSEKINKVKKLPKLDPIFIIKKEMKLFKRKIKKSKIINTYQITI